MDVIVYDYYMKNFKLNTNKKNKKIYLWIDNLHNIQKKYKNKNADEIFILCLREPTAIIPDLKKNVIQINNIFDYIISYDNEILKLKNSQKLLFGNTWINKKYFNKKHSKRFNISSLFGGKNYTNGHKLRHKIYENIENININKKLFLSSHYRGNLKKKENVNIIGDDKIVCFEKSMYHLCIENSKQINYFTEKLMDCFMTETIPVYWGCPNITEYFDENGIIILNTDDPDEIINIINNLKESDYKKKIKYIKKNKEIAYKYLNYHERLKNKIEEIVNQNI